MTDAVSNEAPAPDGYKVDLHGGGEIHLQSKSELDRWTTLDSKYREEYRLSKGNDLAMLDVILQTHMLLYRAQNALNGMEPVLDKDDLPTGRYTYHQPKPVEVERAQKSMVEASKEIRALEKVLGIDRSSREAQGGQTLDSYLTNLKGAANEYGIHVSNRFKAYEQFTADLRWRLRLNENGDEEDRRYHQCDDKDILRWCREELEKLEKIDQEFAHEKQKLWLGRL